MTKYEEEKEPSSPGFKTPNLDQDEDDWCEEESEFAAQSVMGDMPASMMMALPPDLGLPQTPRTGDRPGKV